jgi:hypothetical protein
MYRNSQGLVKINGILTAPFPYARGLRQGDPLSGPLFTLTIETFLLMCNHNLQKYGITVPNSHSKTLVTTAYADNVTVFITRNEGFPQLIHIFMVYGALSGAILNIQKTDGIFTGEWRKRRDRHPRIPMEYARREVPWYISRQHNSLATTKLVTTRKQN